MPSSSSWWAPLLTMMLGGCVKRCELCQSMEEYGGVVAAIKPRTGSFCRGAKRKGFAKSCHDFGAESSQAEHL